MPNTDYTNDFIPLHLIETGICNELQYKPVLVFDEWMIAILRQIDKTNPANFCQAERHKETNEVFILTDGEALLIVFENGDIPGKEYLIQMKKNTAYNIPENVWHHVVMTRDAHIFLFEKKNTAHENSEYYIFEMERIGKIKAGLQKL